MVVYSQGIEVLRGGIPNLGTRAVITRDVGSTILGRFAGIDTMPIPAHSEVLPQHKVFKIIGETDVATGNLRNTHRIGLHEFLYGSARLEILTEQPLEGMEEISLAGPVYFSEDSISELPPMAEQMREGQCELFKITDAAEIEYITAA
jgi:hypothetical protein